MRVVGRLMALLAALLFVAILPCAAWTFGASQLLLSAGTYKTALGNQDVYSDLIPALLPAIAQSDVHTEIHDPQALTLLNIVRNLDEAAWERIAADLIPADWLRRQAESNLDAFFDWLSGRPAAPALAFASARSTRSSIRGRPAPRNRAPSWRRTKPAATSPSPSAGRLGNIWPSSARRSARP